ncbi:MAG: bifunctional DNA-binding transcriptional regulator/O6-methylguanine-DNA methyltransferase Ada [Acidobacteriota bacterium]|nr:MAG: bifunctional DNA-binding transcriptional regulator/O6-methylguanine-DNA methyltransferase Ada [Acidobacteriota bacterium]
MEREIFWKAVAERDERFNGAFFYGVGSTGIYCKPSCSARTPKRENVRFFFDTGAAEQAGFRACKRCRPASERPDAATEAVIRACGVLEESSDISLADLAGSVDMSPAHFQKVFKEIIGVSPRKYGESVRIGKFKEGIKKGNEVIDAMYDAGYGSSSRLYENVSEKLGMTPATYKKGGIGMNIEYTVADCELGKILVARTKKGICAVNFGDSVKGLVEGLKEEYPEAKIARDDGSVSKYLAAILENIKGSRKRLVLPLDLQATAFQLRVWEALREIPYGETVSYADIAKKLGNPKAVRAVAGACAANRVALVIPCHRVVKSNGETSGYKWGKKRKEKLLEKEKVNA